MIGYKINIYMEIKNVVSWHEMVVSRHDTVVSWHDTTISRHITYLYITILASVSRLYYLSIFAIKQSNNILYVFRKFLHAKLIQSIWHLVIISTCNCSSYGSHRICITS